VREHLPSRVKALRSNEIVFQLNPPRPRTKPRSVNSSSVKFSSPLSEAEVSQELVSLALEAS